ncbi:uncharacterized protein LOC110720909 isoform X2 [Chenopodium quinoa]|uniref:Uncharacterized protein n=1 Tax=Chenopodium quinoa TaxID=63459 RepID=A0A803LY11_CHEQI|nr:uncharacterized protein LOC110720909 isoform X2 [Chenopodium quinoa]
MSGTQEEDKKPGDQGAHINLKVKGQLRPTEKRIRKRSASTGDLLTMAWDSSWDEAFVSVFDEICAKGHYGIHKSQMWSDEFWRRFAYRFGQKIGNHQITSEQCQEWGMLPRNVNRIYEHPEADREPDMLSVKMNVSKKNTSGSSSSIKGSSWGKRKSYHTESNGSEEPKLNGLLMRVADELLSVRASKECSDSDIVKASVVYNNLIMRKQLLPVYMFLRATPKDKARILIIHLLTVPKKFINVI